MRRITQVLWGLSVAFLATPGQAVESVWPDDPPIPVFKPAMPAVLAAAELLRLEFLPLLPSPPFAGPTAKVATLAVVPTPTPAAEAAPSASEPPLPVPKPGGAVASTASAASEMLRVELLPPLASGVSLAALEAAAAAGTPSDGQPFAAPPLTSSFSLSVASNAFRFAVPQSGDVSIVPSLELVGLPAADPNLIRMSAPHEPRLTPAPGIGAVMQLGDITLDAKFNQPLRAVETKSSPDTRMLEDRSNFGVDMKVKF